MSATFPAGVDSYPQQVVHVQGEELEMRQETVVGRRLQDSRQEYDLAIFVKVSQRNHIP